ncbi:MAG: Uncharacterized protein G01um101420_816 [Parcubacteria group bacterium Gr01-1014_20]|nr:MAG: Uncharacterized protein G01um101420_816 [Parcubacteria group bacterium Gr01-1014_20]
MSTETGTGRPRTEEFVFNGATLKKDLENAVRDFKEAVSELLKEGRIRKVVIKKSDGTVLESFTLNAGLVGLALTIALIPVILAIGVALGLAASMRYDLKVVIEKEVEATTAPKANTPAGA